MFTKYVFENPRLDDSSQRLKSELYDIVSQAEGNMDTIRTEAFIDPVSEQMAASLQSLYVEGDADLRRLLELGDELTKAVQKLDHNYRRYKQTKERCLKEAASQKQAVQQKPVEKDNKAVDQPVMVSTDQVVQDEGDALAVQDDNSNQTGATEVTIPSSDEIQDEVVMGFDDEAYAAKNGVAEEPKEEAPATDEKKPDAENVSDEVVMGFDDEAYAAKTGLSAEEGEKKEAEGETAPSASDAEATSTDANEPAFMMNEEPSSGPLITPEVSIDTETKESGEDKEEPSSGPLLTPMVDMEDEKKEATDVSSGPVLISPDVSDEKEAAPEMGDGSSAPLLIPEGEEMEGISEDAPFSKPLITPIDTTPEEGAEKDAPAENTPTEPLIPITNNTTTGENQPEELIPTNSSTMIVFKKRTDDPPKAIIVSKKQYVNLNGSFQTQNALLNAQRFFPTGDSLEKQLVDNGLLEADNVQQKQQEIEALMAKAKELYDAGKAEEAEAIYAQINELNKTIQEGATK